MKVAIFSDVHSNLEALEAVFKDMKREEPDKKFFLGDLVGYGPNPNECVELIRENSDVVLAGNHDLAAVGLTDHSYFNPYARDSLLWTIELLTDANKDYLKSLKPTAVTDGVQLSHSSPLAPDEWRYVHSLQDAMDNYDSLVKNVCFIGHSHIPMIIEYADASNIIPIHDIYKTLEPKRKYIINAGSVGQPRDSNREACYLVYDDKIRNVSYRRVEYDLARTQKKMTKAKLPEHLIKRLAEGR
ncbi:MAG: metallophosphoesterase family protein [Nitrospinae bacterium]|nr:metallophosphoesterase family protein [Nitrospinota bacterium]